MLSNPLMPFINKQADQRAYQEYKHTVVDDAHL